jgi:hypothetical protein
VTVTQGRLTLPVATAQYCTVAFVESDEFRAGSYRQTRDPDGTSYQETGNVLCQINTSTADTSASAVPTQQDALFVLLDALEVSVRTDRTLGGVLSPDSNLDLLVEVLSGLTGNGTAESAVLTLNYYTVTRKATP